MKFTDLAQTDACYSVAERARVSWREVGHPGLESFAAAVFELSRLARVRGGDDTGWREFLYPARRARNIATTVPLPFSHPDLGLAPLVTRLEQTLPALRVYGGEDAGKLGADAVGAGRALLALDDAPLADALADVIAPDPSSAEPGNGVVLPIPEYTGAVARFLRGLGQLSGVEVLSAHDLAGARPLGRLVVVGPLYWYRDRQYVLTSPRAPQIVVLKWAWYREEVPATRALEGSSGSAGIRVRPAPMVMARLEVRADDEHMGIDWHSVSEELSRHGEGDPLEAVPARPAVLAGRYGVLLPEDGDRRVCLLDPDAPAAHRVTAVDVADLEPGHVIVLRSAGGGDLIVPIADEILGDRAGKLRGLQHRWKAGLHSWVSGQRGLTKAAAALRRLGCTSASFQNLQNWLGERSLRTENRSDWQVLMRVAGQEDQAEAIWRAMGRLHAAHTSAGRSIGRRLRDMANTQPLDGLLASGHQVFALAQGGSLTAFRIEGFSPTAVQCSPNRLMVPVEVRDEWLT